MQIRSLHKLFVLLVILCFSKPLYSYRQPNDHAGLRVRLHLGPVIGFYKVNPQVASGVSQGLSAVIGLNKEFRLDRNYQAFFLVGLDYLFYKINFNSYYFPPGTIQLYDKNFNYRYNLSVNEINFPLQFKYLFKRENNSLFSPYLGFTYCLRVFMPSEITVTQDGNFVKDDKVDMKFKTPLGNDRVNAAFVLTAGWQKNNLSNSHGSFYFELCYRYNFSQYYFQMPYSPTSLYINGSQLSLQLGIKF